jgi:prophage antirepressor-like protein
MVPFQFESVSVRVVLDAAGEPWFVAKDVAAALGYVNTAQAVREVCKSTKSLSELRKTGKVISSSTLHPQSKLIPEGDIYKLTMASTLPSAEKFKDWVCNEVLPSIRKTGSYSIDKDSEWTAIRQDGKSARKDFVREIGQRGAKTPKDYAMLTDKVNVAATGMPARELKKAIAHFDGITDAKKVQNIAVRDNLNGEMLSRLILVERGSTNRMIAQDAKSVSQCGQAVEDVGLMLEALMAGKTLQIV